MTQPLAASTLSSDPDAPLVSVGIPTFNRLPMLQRAVASVLSQDYVNLEVVISDNASVDDTAAWCEQLAGRDSRVRFIRQAINRGAGANVAEVFRQSHGALYMVLGDDDWLEPSYISRCVQVLLSDPELAVVCGLPRMFRGEIFLHFGLKLNLVSSSPYQRVAKYLWRVGDNAQFHGLMRRQMLASLPPLPNVVAGDWLFVAWLAYLGKIRTIDGTAINKSVEGTTGNWKSILSRTSLPRFSATVPYLIITGIVFRDIAWASPVYARAGPLGRLWLASLATAVLLAKFSLWSAAVVAKRLWYRFTSRPFPLRAV